jgi:hypothetical protein
MIQKSSLPENLRSVSMVLTPDNSVRGVYATASLLRHCRNHATSRKVTKAASLISSASPCNE